MQISSINSKNTQTALFSDLASMIRTLDEEQYLLLPDYWPENEDLVFLKFRAEQKGYKIEYAINAPMSSTRLIFFEIEKAIERVTGLKLEDYSTECRTSYLVNIRVAFTVIARSYRIEKFLIANKLNKNEKVISTSEAKHRDMFKFSPEYRRMYNDIMQEMINNKVVENI